MNKLLYYIGITIFGGLGAYIPTFFGAGALSAWSIFGSVIGGFIGIYLVYTLIKNM